MYQPSDGDRVRVVLEGEAGGVRTGAVGAGFTVGGANWIRLRGDHVVSVEKLDDPEPPAGSVVIDSDGDAWQRKYRGWLLAATRNDEDDYLTWSALSDCYAPIKIVYTPESV